jgi:vancomycin resistance protein YoaR
MAATQPVATEPRALRIPRPGRMARRSVIVLLFGVLAVLGGLYAFGQAYAGRILPGMSIGGVDVSGMTAGEARTAVDAAFGGLENGQITVTSPRATTVIDFDEVGRVIDRDGMVAAAMDEGRAGTRLEEALAGIRGLNQPATLPLLIDYDRDALTMALASFRGTGYRAPIDAGVLKGNGGFVVRGAVDGVSVATDSVAAQIDEILLDPASPTTSLLAADAQQIKPATSDADAARALTAAQRIATPLKVTAGDRAWPITAKRIRTWMSFAGAGASYAPVLDRANVPAALKAVEKAVLTKPREARYLKTRSGSIFGVAASSAGRALDMEATGKAVLAALEARAAGPVKTKPIKVKMMAVAPQLTTSEATKRAPLVERVGTWTTYYQPGPGNGFSANISVPARRLDGLVIKPGQTFDFWGALGEISFRTGYRMGNAIIGGHTAEGRALAGGICSTSTTLFNAAARAGLDIVSRRPHWYYISRYPLGLDATVSDTQNMRFRNDTGHPILIKSFASPGVVRFEIWSLPNGRTVTWSRPHVTNVVRGYDTVQYTSALRRGERKRIEHPVDGKHVVVTRTVRDAGGRVINSDTFVSNYHRMVGIMLVGR